VESDKNRKLFLPINAIGSLNGSKTTGNPTLGPFEKQDQESM
jgi:hypothetical protein